MAQITRWMLVSKQTLDKKSIRLHLKPFLFRISIGPTTFYQFDDVAVCFIYKSFCYDILTYNKVSSSNDSNVSVSVDSLLHACFISQFSSSCQFYVYRCLLLISVFSWSSQHFANRESSVGPTASAADIRRFRSAAPRRTLELTSSTRWRC